MTNQYLWVIETHPNELSGGNQLTAYASYQEAQADYDPTENPTDYACPALALLCIRDGEEYSWAYLCQGNVLPSQFRDVDGYLGPDVPAAFMAEVGNYHDDANCGH